MSQVKRNGNIEILRFVFIVLIILHHFEESVFNGAFFTAGYLGVEFFFIITGIFLGKRLKAQNEKGRAESFGAAAREGAEYVWKRICGIYPYFFLATLIGFAARLAIGVDSPDLSTGLALTGDFGLVQLFGPSKLSLSTTGVVWYLSALFFALLLIYPFARKYYNAWVYSFALLFPPFLMGNTIKIKGNLGAILDRIFDIFNVGILRAVAMICVGLVVNELVDRVKALPTNRLNCFVFTAGELILYPALLVYLVFVERSTFDYLTVILMALALTITLSEKSCLYGRFDNAFAMFLGKASMILFLCHYFWVNYISKYAGFLPSALQKGIVTDLVLGFALTFVTSVAVYFGGNLLRFLFRKGKTALFAPPQNAA